MGINVREHTKEWFPLGTTGSGLQQVLVILTELIRHSAKIALIEEFDSSLSPRKRSELLGHFVEIAGREHGGIHLVSQIITTTHGSFNYGREPPLGIAPVDETAKSVDFKPVNKKYWEHHSFSESKA